MCLSSPATLRPPPGYCIHKKGCIWSLYSGSVCYMISWRSHICRTNKRRRTQRGGLPHMWLSLCCPPTMVPVKKWGEHDPIPSRFPEERRVHCAVCNSRRRHEWCLWDNDLSVIRIKGLCLLLFSRIDLLVLCRLLWYCSVTCCSTLHCVSPMVLSSSSILTLPR